MTTYEIEKIEDDGTWEGIVRGGRIVPVMRFRASPSLWLIRQAWDKGMDLEDLADGYGAGAGTHGDWSGVRDSSDEAVAAMLGRALTYMFGDVQ